MNRAVLVPLEAYLLGSIPTGYLLYRWRYGRDIRTVGSGNIGATNVARTAGAALGVVTLIIDAAKGFFAVALADYLAYTHVSEPYIYMKTGFDVPQVHYNWLALALLLVLFGHVFTPWLRLRGGKGVATGLGAFLAVAPKSVAAAAVVFLIALAIWRFVSLASMLATIAMPWLVWWQYRGAYPQSIMMATAAAACLILWRHRSNLQRIIAGTEPHVGQRV